MALFIGTNKKIKFKKSRRKKYKMLIIVFKFKAKPMLKIEKMLALWIAGHHPSKAWVVGSNPTGDAILDN